MEPTDFWTAQAWARCVGGKWVVRPVDEKSPVAGVTIDSRSVAPGQAFVAIRGQRHDGHDFLLSVLQQAPGLIVVHDEAKAAKAIADFEAQGLVCATPVLCVPDTIAALGDLAKAYRISLQNHGTTVIAVTGSNGKTTTRNLIHGVLSYAPGEDLGAGVILRGSQSPKSFNNHIGVPLTLLAAKPNDDYVVVEQGTNHPGEIDPLARIVGPDVAVITSVGLAHTATLGDLDAIIREKASLIGHVRDGGLAVVYGDEPRLVERAKRELPAWATLWTFGRGPENQFQLLEVAGDDTGSWVKVCQKDTQGVERAGFRLPQLGEHNALNALAAAAVGRRMGLAWRRISSALAQVSSVDMRLEVWPVGPKGQGVVLINDAYNANPTSMAAGLATLAQYPLPQPDGRRVAILGDMLELGDLALELHAQMGRAISEINRRLQPGTGVQCTDHETTAAIGTAVFIGPLSRAGFEALAAGSLHGAEAHYFEDWTSDLPDRVADLLRAGDVVLIKASRGIGLDRLVPAIEARFAHVPAGQTTGAEAISAGSHGGGP